MELQAEVFWVLMPCSVAIGYKHFGGPCCFHLQGEVTSLLQNLHVETFVSLFSLFLSASASTSM
jgi:hypothetical protein